MTDWTVEPLADAHERATFECGQPTLDAFLRQRAGQYERRRLGRTFVAVPVGSRQVLGYYTIAAGSIVFAHLPADAARKLPGHPIPVVLLARLAVASSAQGRGIGEGLLVDALRRTLEVADAVGVHAVSVDAINAGAAAFYARYGFRALSDDTRRLYLPLSTLQALFGR